MKKIMMSRDEKTRDYYIQLEDIAFDYIDLQKKRMKEQLAQKETKITERDGWVN